MQSLNDLVNLLIPYFPALGAFLAGAAAQKWFKLAEALLALLPKRAPAPLTQEQLIAAIKEANRGDKPAAP